MSFGRGMYERNFQRLVEDHLTSIESANSFGRLLPAREVVDQLGHCRRHNFDRRDEALLGQVRLARGRLDSRWLEVAAREARAINMWDREWIRHHIFNPDSSHAGPVAERDQKIRLGLLQVIGRRLDSHSQGVGWCHPLLLVLRLQW